MRKWLQTYSRINGDKFLIVFLMLFASPFWFCVLPLLIFSAPMRLIWRKPVNQSQWRCGSLFSLLLSLSIGFYCAFMVSYEKDGLTYQSFPISYAHHGGGWFAPDADTQSYMMGWVPGLNLSLVAGVLMLPLTMASYFETRHRLRQPRQTAVK